MAGLRSGQEERYMRFVVQYYSRVDDRWYRIGAGGDSGYLSIGKGRKPRQFGRSFRIEPVPGQPVLLRGRVYFQWRVKGAVVRRAKRADAQGPPLEHRRRPRGLLGVDVHDHVGLEALSYPNSRGSLEITPVTPQRSSSAIRAASSTVQA